MAIHRHPGDEMNLPLARAVIGGLAGSTLLTLFTGLLNNCSEGQTQRGCPKCCVGRGENVELNRL